MIAKVQFYLNKSLLILHNFEVCGKEVIVLFDTKLCLIFLNSNISGYVEKRRRMHNTMCVIRQGRYEGY